MTGHDTPRHDTNADYQNILGRAIAAVEDENRELERADRLRRLRATGIRPEVRAMGERIEAFSLHPLFGSLPSPVPGRPRARR